MGYKIFNGPMPTVAAQQTVATGTAIKTHLQIAPPSTRMLQIISWGFSLDALQTGEVELLQTDVAATVIAHIASGITIFDPNGVPSLVTLGVAATGYTASAEGSITAVRMFDAYSTGPSASASYFYQWMPDERPVVAVSKFLRVRATMGVTTNIRCWVSYNEVG